jgi:hypothetical protein
VTLYHDPQDWLARQLTPSCAQRYSRRMGRNTTLWAILGAITLITAAGCNAGDECGAGTTEVDGVCVGNGGDGVCGEGTILVDGECVPDGSVICETGTTFNEETGRCDPDIGGCGEGTVLIDGECVPEDGADLEVDLEEEPEPNDGFEAGDGIAGAFDLPAVGADGVVLHGCVNPYRDVDGNGNSDIDYDMWLVQTSGPALLEATADGVGGLAAGYFLIPGDQQELIDAGWQRFGINLAGDTSQRQVYLPAAGLYALVMSDSRSLFLTDGAAGSETSCYYTTVSQVALPSPTAVTLDTLIEGEIGTDTVFYSYDPEEGSIIDAIHGIDSAAASPSLVALRNGQFAGYGVPGFFTPDAEVIFGGMEASDEILIAVEPVYNYALAPVDYSLFVDELRVVALPTDGNATVTSNGPVWNVLDDLTFAWFDVGAGEVVHFDLSFSQNSGLLFTDGNLNIIALMSFPDDDPPIPGYEGWIRFPSAGRYYAVLFDPGAAAGDTFEVASRINRVTPTPIDVGTPMVDVPFSDLEATWHTFDPSGETWLALNAGATGFGGDVVFDIFDSTDFGEVDVDFGPVGGWDFPRNGNRTFGRVVFGDENNYLVRVTDESGAANGGDSYDLSVVERDFTDLIAVEPGSPVDLDDATIGTAAGAVERFFVQAVAGDTVSITVTPTDFNARIQIVDADENVITQVNAGGPGEPETIETVAGAGQWVAFQVRRVGGGVGTTFDLALTATSPVPYASTAGTLPFTDVCGAGDDITPADADEGLTGVFSMPFAFPLFGSPSGGDYRVSTNGWLAFGAVGTAAFSNAGFPNAALPNGIVAPYWDDLDLVTICQLEEAEQVTIQWTGERFFDPTTVQFQAVLHSDGSIDYIYGAGQQADGVSGSVGIENLSGIFGHQYVFNSAGAVQPDTSRTLTPAP